MNLKEFSEIYNREPIINLYRNYINLVAEEQKRTSRRKRKTRKK